MNKPKISLARSRPSAGLILVLILAPLGTIGCASSEPSLTLTSINHNQVYRQGFTQAYCNHNSNGDCDVVLIDRATEQALNGESVTAAVRQVMHIRIVWAPTRDMKAVVSNAAVKWYVIGRSGPHDVLEYSGIAFVSLDDDQTAPTLKVRNALLTPSQPHGHLTDPVGPSRLEGSFVARQDALTVNRILSELQTSVAGAAPTSLPPPVASSDEQGKGIER